MGFYPFSLYSAGNHLTTVLQIYYPILKKEYCEVYEAISIHWKNGTRKERCFKYRHCLKSESVRIRSYSGPYSVRMWKNVDQNNSEYGHFSRSSLIQYH